MVQVPKTLTVAGSDSGGGAGIQADLKTFSALSCYGMSAITALTAQNTQGVSNISGVEPNFIKDQLKAIFEDLGADAVKIGMLHADDLINTVSDNLAHYNPSSIVLDPVMVAKSGDRLLQKEAIEALISKMVPMATIITPNIPEGEVLLGKEIANEEAMGYAAKELAELGPEAVLIKGGHLSGDFSPDVLYVKSQDKVHRLTADRISTQNTHGTGCTLSSAIAAYLARGFTISEAVHKAKTYMDEALRAGKDWDLGKGKGPVNHFYKWWS